jgi:hypothetical protein
MTGATRSGSLVDEERADQARHGRENNWPPDDGRKH